MHDTWYLKHTKIVLLAFFLLTTFGEKLLHSIIGDAAGNLHIILSCTLFLLFVFLALKGVEGVPDFIHGIKAGSFFWFVCRPVIFGLSVMVFLITGQIEVAEVPLAFLGLLVSLIMFIPVALFLSLITVIIYKKWFRNLE
jgi:hypothetical protein